MAIMIVSVTKVKHNVSCNLRPSPRAHVLLHVLLRYGVCQFKYCKLKMETRHHFNRWVQLIYLGDMFELASTILVMFSPKLSCPKDLEIKGSPFGIMTKT